MAQLNPVEAVLRVQSIAKAIAKVLRDEGPTSRGDLQAKLSRQSHFKAVEVDAALSNVKYVVDENDVLSMAP
jgi:hypothetical protein